MVLQISRFWVIRAAKCVPARKRQGGFEAFPSRGVQKRRPFAPAARQMMPERGVQGQSTSKVMEISKINGINKQMETIKTNKINKINTINKISKINKTSEAIKPPNQ